MRNIYGKTETNLICDFALDIPKEFVQEESTFSRGQNFSGDEEDVVYLE
jgi:hypothetical protein